MWCEVFEHDRERLASQFGFFGLKNLVSKMLESPTAWVVIAEYVDSVMTVKEIAERERQQKDVAIQQRQRIT